MTDKIMIVDSDLMTAAMLKSSLRVVSSQEIDVVSNVSEAAKLVVEEAPDVILINISPGNEDEDILFGQLMSSTIGASVIYTGNQFYSTEFRRVLCTDNIRFLEKPLEDNAIVNTFRELRKAS